MKIVTEKHFNRTVKVYEDRPKNLTEMLRQTVNDFSEKEALVASSERLTYRQLWDNAEFTAGNLHYSYEIQKGDRVAILVGNKIEFALLVFACARIGAIAVTLNTRLQEMELSYMLNHSGAKVLIVDHEFIDKVEKMRHQGSLGEIQHFFVIGRAESGRKDYLPFELLLQKTVPPNINVDEDDPLFIMYTSGTTGKPKGAIGCHLGVIHSVMNYEHVLKTNSRTRTVIAVPLFHVTGMIGQLLHMVRVGGTSVIMGRFKTGDYIRLISEENITFLFNVPTIYVMMMSHPDFTKHSYHSVNCIVYGGSSMSEETISCLQKAFPGTSLHNAYGATETSSPTTILPQDCPESKIQSVGRAVPVAEVKVVDEGGNPCRSGEVGQLLIKGPMVIEGYWNNEEANRKSFVDGYWCSGDLAKIDEEGYVYIMDRMKDMINRGGEKIYSVEVENVLYNHPKILEAAVVGIPDGVFGEAVKAFVIPKEDAVITEEEVQQFVRERLADYKVPASIEFISELPRNPGGKVIKGKLKEKSNMASSNKGSHSCNELI
ncbi:class I adenylate-forming enzyme family protein [Effusibacillus consociatus]|uniref:Class I adenylate-forming enzyme family protein n=1 Tax=Effusibacillus consociatus TaxID=1117041 RepID=A0ABV9Q175_9BACL